MKLTVATLLLATTSSLAAQCGETTHDVEIGPPTWSDQDGDGAWEAGEALEIGLLLTNLTHEDLPYIGVILSSDSPYVDVSSGQNWFYVLPAHEPMELPLFVTATKNAPRGAEVTFVATLDQIGCTVDCATAEPLEFVVGID